MPVEMRQHCLQQKFTVCMFIMQRANAGRVETMDVRGNRYRRYEECQLYDQPVRVHILMLKYESGVHRVQRVPETESGGRIHTSTITVAIMPEAEEVDVQIGHE